eukprot:50720-Amphidinium_carterae.1
MRLHDDFFMASLSKCSLPAEAVDQIVSTNPTFATLSAIETRNACIRSACVAVAHYQGEWSEMQKCWKSMLLHP